MNPYSPDQTYPLYIVENALVRCIQERENAEFLIETKKEMIELIQQGVASMNHLDDEIVLSNGLVLPSPRIILEHDIQHHQAVIDRQEALLTEYQSAEGILRNAIRRHKQSQDRTNMRRLIDKQKRYDRHQTFQNDLQRLEHNLSVLKQELDQDMVRLEQLRNQATPSSSNNSAVSKND